MKKTLILIILMLIFLSGLNSVNASTVFYAEPHFGGKATVSIFSTEVLHFGGSLLLTGDSAPMQSTPSPSNDSTNQNFNPTLSIICTDVESQTMTATWWSNSSGTWTIFATNNSITSGSTISQTTSNFSSYASKYWWRVNLTDGTNWDNDTYSFTTKLNPSETILEVLHFGGSLRLSGDAPEITSVSPSNGSTNIDIYPYLNITVYDIYGDYLTATWTTNASDTWTYSNNTIGSGTFQQRATFANQSNTTYWFTVVVKDFKLNQNNYTYHFTTKAYNFTSWSNTWNMYLVDFAEPTNLNAIHINTTQINLSWNKNISATNTHIRGKIGSVPASVNDGELVYNNTGTWYNHTSLNPGTHYYYRAWSWNSSTNTFSDGYTDADSYTNPGNPIDFMVTGQSVTSIDLQWTKGTNATNSVIIKNDTGYADYPTSLTNGTVVYNDTGSTTTISSLSPNATYYFTIWSYYSGYFSEGNATASGSTMATSDAPYNLVATSNNDTKITLTWGKGNTSYTVIRMNTGSYPTLTTGTEIFNSTTNTFVKTGLTACTHYYFRAWGYNGVDYSLSYTSSDNITLPQAPINLVGNINDTYLEITWTKGSGAVNTILSNNTTGYPTNPQGTDVFYNTTGTSTVQSGVTDINYYVGWSYALVEGRHLYSESKNMLWGGLEINVYKENETSISILNYTVFITNATGSETYQRMSCNNPTRININQLPTGEDIAVTISKNGYYPRTIYKDFYQNIWYTMNFYLSGTPSGGGVPGEPDYIEPTNATNESSYLYFLRVVETVTTEYTSYDKGVEGCKVSIRRYINATDLFEDISVLYTDANGFINLYLIPHNTYKILINKSGYYDAISDYIPQPPNIYGQTTEKDFRVTEIGMGGEDGLPDIWIETVHTNITYSFYPPGTRYTSTFTFYYNISSSDNQLEWIRMDVYFYNESSGTYILLSEQNVSNPSGGILYYTIPDSTGKYVFKCYYKKIGYAEYEIGETGSLIKFLVHLKEALVSVPDYAWFLITIIIMIVVMGVCIRYFGTGITTGYIGLGIFAVMLLLKNVTLIIDGIPFSGWLIWGITFLIYTMGVYLYSRI